MTPGETKLLIEILARADALWSCPRVYSRPARCLPSAAWAATVERREAFAAVGVDLHSRGGAAARKIFERQLGDMQDAGLVTIATKSGRRFGVKLTPRGDDLARWFAAEPLLHECWPTLQRIADLIAAGVCRGCLVREDDLARTEYSDPDVSAKLSDQELHLLPLKAAGLVDDSADREGRIWYSLTTSGRAALRGPAPAMPADLPPYVSDWCDLHTEMVDEALRGRLSWTPETRSLVVVPVSCGVSPAKSWRD